LAVPPLLPCVQNEKKEKLFTTKRMKGDEVQTTFVFFVLFVVMQRPSSPTANREPRSANLYNAPP